MILFYAINWCFFLSTRLLLFWAFHPFFIFAEKNYFSQPDIHNNLHIVIAVTINRHAHTLSDLIYESKQPKKNKSFKSIHKQCIILKLWICLLFFVCLYWCNNFFLLLINYHFSVYKLLIYLSDWSIKSGFSFLPLSLCVCDDIWQFHFFLHKFQIYNEMQFLFKDNDDDDDDEKRNFPIYVL